MHTVKVAGLGPGGKDYMLPACLKAIEESDIIIGAERHIEALAVKGKRVIIFDGQLKSVIDFIKTNAGKHRIIVVVSGDTGFYSLLRYLKQNLPDIHFDIIPGVSAMSLMFARLGMLYDDAYLGSAHGKAPEVEILAWAHSKVGLLTDRINTPARIAKRLIDAGITEKVIAVGERLSYPDERIRKLTLEEAAKGSFEPLSVVVIYDENINI